MDAGTKTTGLYLVPECNLSELEARIEKLNRRAKRLGVEPIKIEKKVDHVKHQVRQLTVHGHMNLCWLESIEKRTDLPPLAFLANAFEPTGVVMQWWTVSVGGQTPSFNGWEFIAVLEPMTTEDGETLNLVQTVPGKECPAEYRDAIGRCDHCKADRRRKQTFVVRHETGKHKSVGRQCIKDFLGYNGDPHQLAHLAELIAELGTLCGSAEDEEWLGDGGSGRESRAWDLKHFLTLTACRIRLFGWLGRSKARDMNLYSGGSEKATADKVLELLNPPSPRYASSEQIRQWEEFSSKHVTEDRDAAEAELAIEWAKAINPEELEANNYLANVNLVARVGHASRKTAGVAASIIVAYQKAVDWEVNRQKQEAKPPSNHVGEVGKRIKLIEVTVEKVIANESDWGVTYIHKMHDAVGNDMAWFATGGRLDEGKTYAVAATVKKHDEYNGRKQTILARVSVWGEQGLAEYRAKEARKAARAAKKLAKELQGVQR